MQFLRTKSVGRLEACDDNISDSASANSGTPSLWSRKSWHGKSSTSDQPPIPLSIQSPASQYLFSDDGDTISDLKHTITNLKLSKDTQTQQFNTLQTSHDKLYKEHIHLQSQMDDAVELLKYLKVEKSTNEKCIDELNMQISILKHDGEDGGNGDGNNVVSLTIEKLTKEKMELENALKEKSKASVAESSSNEEDKKRIAELDIENSELLCKIDMLEQKVTATTAATVLDGTNTSTAADSSSKENEEIVADLCKEKDILQDRIKELEDISTHENEQHQLCIQEYETKLSILQSEQDELRQQQQQRSSEEGNKEEEVSQLKSQLNTSLETIAKLKRSTSSTSLLSQGFGTTEKYEALQQEQEEMKIYIKSMEDTLLSKNEMLDTLQEEYTNTKVTLSSQVVELQTKVDTYNDERTSYQQQINSYKQKQEVFKDQLSSQQENEVMLQDQLTSYQQQQQKQGGTEAEESNKQLTIDNDNLQKRIQELQDQIENQSQASSQQYPPAELEKEMQGRLAKRIAKQLHDSKIQLETQIRSELESEYRTNPQKGGNVTELENQLRQQLQQVTAERERWQFDQEEINKKLINSQVQFGKVRDGFKKKLDKEKNRYHELEKTNESQIVVIEKLSEEYQDVSTQLTELRLTLSHHQTNNDQWEVEKADILHKHTIRIHELQTEINDLINTQTNQEEEYKCAMDDMEQLNVENAEYLEKIQEYEKRVVELEEQESEFEASRVKFSALTNEQTELKTELSKREEQNDDLIKQMEALNNEHNDLQEQINTLEEKIGTTQDERNKLQDSLQETSQLCLQMEAKLSSYKHDKDNTIEEYEGKVEGLQQVIAEKEVELVDLRLASTTEKDETSKAIAEVESRHEEAITDLQGQVTDSAAQVSKLIDQLSTISNEKADLVLELTSVKKEAEAQASDLAHLESSFDALTEERDTANSRVTELMSGNESVEKVLSDLKLEKDELVSKAEEREKVLSELQAEKDELVSKADERETTINELVSKADEREKIMSDLQSEKEEVLITISEKDELLSKAEERETTISGLEAEKEEALTNVAGLQTKIDSQSADLDESKSKLDELKAQIEVTNEQQAKVIEEKDALVLTVNEHKETIARLEAEKEEMLLANKDSSAEPDNDHKAKIQELQTEIDKLKDANAQLIEDKVSLEKNQNHSAAPQSNETTIDNDELRDLKDNNILLQEAVQDIQVEKEDLELENEELATKLTDLTTQAKKMLLNNESLEEALQDQMMEYEDRILELEGMLEEFDVEKEDDSKSPQDDDDKKELTRLEEENLELRQIIDHCSSENEAAKEIKLIVHELKAKNMELSESLNVSQEQNDSAADIIERLKSDNERLQKEIKSDEPNGAISEGGDEDKMKEMEAEMQRLKLQLSQFSSDRNVFNNRLSQLMDIDNGDAAANTGTEGDEGVLVTTDNSNNINHHLNGVSSDALVLANGEGVDETIQHLTIENGQLAQRLGNAVADKEFAMTTLSKLGAKMEELIERNKLLSNLADMKTKHGSRGAKYYTSGGDQSVASGHRESNDDRRGLDPDLSVKGNEIIVSSSGHQSPLLKGDSSVLSGMESTILSFDKPPLEPESASVLGSIQEQQASREESGSKDASDRTPLSEPKLIKVKGGEYIGTLNSRGQKHGDGKMMYDNGNEYVGRWKNNKRDGKGTTKYASGNVYTGTWKEGKRHGFGVFHIQKTGDIYRGNWKAGLKSGPGVYEYDDGELDVSFYKEDMRAGEGVRWSASRDEASRLVDGQLVGKEGDMSVDDAMKLTKSLGFVV